MVGLAIIFAAALQGKTTLYSSYFPQPSGDNGMEEYLRAADLMNDPMTTAYSEDPPSPFVTQTEESKEARMKLASLDYLENRKEFVNRFERAYDLVVAGNLKPCYPPAATDTYVKGITSDIQLAELITARAYCLSAQGKQSESLDTLLNGFTFTLRSGTIDSMGYSCGVLGERKLFDAMQEQLPRLSLADTQRLSSYVEHAITQPPVAQAVILRAGKVHEVMLQKVSIADAVTGTEDVCQDFKVQLAGAGKNDRDHFDEAVRRDTTALYQGQAAVLQAPESDWYDLTANWSREYGNGKAAAGSSMGDLAQSMSKALVPSHRNLVISELRRRAQLRLLGLHAKIAEFRWRKHKLPASLSEVAKDIFDPLSGEAFVYESKSDGSYRLYSKGRPETGQIELHYTRVVDKAAAMP